MISLETEEFTLVTPTCGLTVNMVADRLFEVYVYDVKTPPVNKQWSVKVSGDAGNAIDDAILEMARRITEARK